MVANPTQETNVTVSARATKCAFVQSILSAAIAWLGAAVAYLVLTQSREPHWWIAVLGCLVQLACELVASHSFTRMYVFIGVVSGQLTFWFLTPVVGGRYISRVDELLTLSHPHFGGITVSIVGGLIAAIVTRYFVGKSHSGKLTPSPGKKPCGR